MQKSMFPIIFLLTSMSFNSIAGEKKFHEGSLKAPQPTTCIQSTFTKTTTSGSWWNINLKLTNACGKDVDLQNSSVSFNNKDVLNTNFWGDFGSVSYPTSNSITSQPAGLAGNLATLVLNFPNEPWAKTNLPNGQSITIKYGAPTASFDASSLKVYLAGAVVQSGKINLTNTTAKPSTATQNYAVVNLSIGDQKISTVQVPWSGQFTVSDLSPGTYKIQPQNFTDSEGATFQGAATPASLVVVNDSTVTSSIAYKKVAALGSINVKTNAMPTALSGYTLSPVITLTRADTGAVSTQSVGWNTSSSVSNIENNVTFKLSTPDITFGGSKCTGTFDPASVISKTTSPNTATLTYSCAAVAQDSISVKINGVPVTTNTINVKFQPADGSTAISKDIAISGGTGTDSVSLTDGMVYNVSSTTLPNLTALFNPQPLTAKAGVTATINYQAATGGRIMAYIPGWKTPPTAASMSAAGYTNALIAFGVFSKTQPGQITPAFDTVTKAYIDSLHQVGIKVTLSLGGASTSIANTSVDFHEVLSLAASPSAFQQTFIQSVENLVTQYGFDGIDIDIEHGITASGTFAAPAGDIAVLANILNTLHQKHPELLISLTPQLANAAPTPGFTETWGNYASLIMQTHDALSWVGMQVYNTGCVYGLDLVCYGDTATDPNLSVAVAAGLLENWPAKTASGQSTGFQPYIGYLKPEQVVLGYPAPNKSGVSDGLPAKTTATIKRAIQCLRTATAGTSSCGTYVPPKKYPNIGGVFEWEITYDQDNSFKFATDLKACVKDGTC
jgi:chitinase/ribosomal 50S subunit-recycling heat shock protein